MIHARKDYDRIQDPDELIPDDEPVFLLRGQDVLAPSTLKYWADKLEAAGGDSNMVQIVRDHAQAMYRWQAKHKVKLPDL